MSSNFDRVAQKVIETESLGEIGMTELLTAAQMRSVEQAAIESGHVSGLELMERAGRGVVGAMLEAWPELDARAVGDSQLSGVSDEALALGQLEANRDEPLRALVLCGPGNNGGDGFVVARLLHDKGWAVQVFLIGDPEKLPPDARTNFKRWLELGDVHDMSRLETLRNAPPPDVIIDALFGTGLTRRIEGLLNEVLQTVETIRRENRAKVVSVDIPSGLCADSGKPLGDSVTANLTVSFHSAKRGHFLEAGAVRSGDLVIKDIGLKEEGRRSEGTVVRLTDSEEIYVKKHPHAHKYCFGHALILSGGAGKTGAARLAARGALRIGAGLVTLGVPTEAHLEAASHVTAIMLQTIETAEHLTEALADKRLNALCLGPALGLDRARDLVPVALASGRCVVLDADALTAFAADPNLLFDQLHQSCVLTPHGGEFARLFPDIAERLSAEPVSGPVYSKIDATQDAARRAGCTVLYKGSDTVIAASDGQCSVNSALYGRETPWLATAGAGDVLAGFVTGLLAQGLQPMRAAEVAAWLHVECAWRFGPGLIAEDLPEQLPMVLNHMGR